MRVQTCEKEHMKGEQTKGVDSASSQFVASQI